ncbi:serine-rich adhesin for platelets-like, partial [Battus philenor]|uniref:serine-rich adhesin for platelets-like n=1 Tax=Battus philenor TaxID=42288 RepID=UPI0035CFA2DC
MYKWKLQRTVYTLREQPMLLATLNITFYPDILSLFTHKSYSLYLHNIISHLCFYSIFTSVYYRNKPKKNFSMTNDIFIYFSLPLFLIIVNNAILIGQNVKSIIWPPPSNPPDGDDIRKDNLNSVEKECAGEKYNQYVKKENYGLKTFSNEQKCSEKVSREQTAVNNSNVSFSTATMSTAASSSSQSAFMVQSTQSGLIQQTTSSVKSVTEHASSQNETLSVYESQLNPKDFSQLSIDNRFEDNTIQSHVSKESSNLESSTKTISKTATTFNQEKQISHAGVNITKDINKLTCNKGKAQNVQYLPDTISISKQSSEKKVKTEMKEQEINRTISVSSVSEIIPESFTSTLCSTEKSGLLSFSNLNEKPKMTPSFPEDRATIEMKPKITHNIDQQIKRNTPSKPIKIKDASRITNERMSQEQTDNKKDMAFLGSSTAMQDPSIGRVSLRDALTIAPERPYSPFCFSNIPKYYTWSSAEKNPCPLDSDIMFESPILKESNQSIIQQNPSDVPSSAVPTSAFKPVAKQVFPPPKPEEFATHSNSALEKGQSNLTKTIPGSHEITNTEIKSGHYTATSTCQMNTENFSFIETAQKCSEKLDNTDFSSRMSDKATFNSELVDNRFDSVTNPDQILSQKIITPDFYNAAASSTKKRASTLPSSQRIQQDHIASTAFQPVTEEVAVSASPIRSRPTTPSLINKPAPIIPHYQMNLVTVEHSAPRSQLYEPSSTEVSRSSTPLHQSRSPGQIIHSGNLKAQAPRIKGSALQELSEHIGPVNLTTDHEKVQKEIQTNVSSNLYAQKNPEQYLILNESGGFNLECQTENYKKGTIDLSEDSLINKNYGQKQMQTHNASEYGNTQTVQTFKKTYEEFEQMQRAKVVEIKKEGSILSEPCQQIKSNFQPSNTSRHVFPPPVMNLSVTHENSPSNITNKSVATATKQSGFYEPIPSISGANHGPVCDPTPS